MERSEVQFGRTRIGYSIRRSNRRRTVSIAVDPDEGVLLTAPANTSVSKLDHVVHQKARWILDRIRARRALHPALPAREFISGETFLYLGRQYRLKVIPTNGEVRPLALKAGWFTISAPASLAGKHRPGYVRAALIDWYRRRAEDRLPERVVVWSEKARVSEPVVVISEQQKRWGSCDHKGTLRLNWRIIQGPTSLVDYVVAHEVCHLVHQEHTAEFWRMLGRILPDYEHSKAELKKLGPRLEW